VNLNHAVGLAAMLVLVAVGICIGYLIWGRQHQAIDEKPAPMVWHDDGSLTAIRAPSAKPSLPEPSVPEGGKVIRTIELTVKPTKKAEIGKTQDTNPGEIVPADCAPVSVRVDMTAHDDGLRVSMRADGGEILDAVDIPRDTIYLPRETRHVAGIDRIGDTTTVRYGMTFGALDVGPAVALEGGRVSVGGWLGYRF